MARPIAVSPWRTVTLIPSQDVPRQPHHEARRDLVNGKRRGATVAATEMWRRNHVLGGVFPTETYRLVHRPGISPALAYARHVYRTIATSIDRLHGAVSGVCDERQIVHARVQDRDEPRVLIDEMVVHFTPSAFSNRFREPKKGRIRQEWFAGRDVLIARVQANIAEDVPTRIYGDFNHKGRSIGSEIDGCRVRYVSHGIDKVIVVDSPTRKWQVRQGWRRIFRLFSDHRGLSARMRVRVLARRKVRG